MIHLETVFDITKIEKAVASSLSDYDLLDYGITEDLPDNIRKVYDYLPAFFTEELDKQYIDELFETFKLNYVSEHFQAAYIYYHMLFMTAIYFVIYKLYLIDTAEMEIALTLLLKDKYKDLSNEKNTRNGKLFFGSFAVEKENDVFQLLRLIGLDSSMLGLLQERVKKRNSFTHANGKLELITEDALLEEINTYNHRLEMVFSLFRPKLEKFYFRTITKPEFYDPSKRKYADPYQQITKEFISKYPLSMKEINWIRKRRLRDFDNLEGEYEIKYLHSALIHCYEKNARNDYQPFNDKFVRRRYHNNAEEFVQLEYGKTSVEYENEGDEYPVYTCIECGESQMVYDVDSRVCHCFACDTDFVRGVFAFCFLCGSIMRYREQIICDDCLKNLK